MSTRGGGLLLSMVAAESPGRHGWAAGRERLSGSCQPCREEPGASPHRELPRLPRAPRWVGARLLHGWPRSPGSSCTPGRGDRSDEPGCSAAMGLPRCSSAGVSAQHCAADTTWLQALARLRCHHLALLRAQLRGRKVGATRSGCATRGQAGRWAGAAAVPAAAPVPAVPRRAPRAASPGRWRSTMAPCAREQAAPISGAGP